jgi:SAM-dependent methyltransferase
MGATRSLPPLQLAHRVGSLEHADDPMALYKLLGRETRDQLLTLLPNDWTFSGKRVLDFGCGAGRTFRHFLEEAQSAEFWGCDIDAASIDWVKENLSPPIHAFQNAPEPPLSRPDCYFDLVYAISVFTHLTDTWSEWLLELHRVLAEDGMMITTYMGAGMSETIAGEPWQENRVGMNVLRAWQDWEHGGPMVMHSNWWIRAHWGRAFEIMDVMHQPSMEGELGRHSWLLMRKRPVSLSPADLEQAERGEERELRALQHNIRQLRAEQSGLVRDLAMVQHHLEAECAHGEQLKHEMRELVEGYENSVSWKITKPLRAAAGKARRR